MWLVQGVLVLCILKQAHGWEEIELFMLNENTPRDGNPTHCQALIEKYLDNLNLGTPWARRMADATGKFPSGIMDGNIYEYGSFDECLAIDDVKDDIQGMYCMGNIPLPVNSSTIMNQKAAASGILSYLWGVCVPDGCTASEIAEYFPEKLNLTFADDFCQSQRLKPALTVGDKLAITFFAIILALVIASSIYDIYTRRSNHTPIDILLCFSFITNGIKLFTVRDDPNQIKCIGGIRTITMMWIVLGHMYFYYLLVPTSNLATVVKFFLSDESMFIKGATVSVDTFFLLSGIVMVYVFMKTKTESMCFNVPLYYLHRYLRLTPSLAIVIFIQVTLLKHFGSGPMWPSSNASIVQPCRDYWWSALLYVQNWVNPNVQCVGVSWYLSLDMQLFLVSPLILIPLKKYTKITLSAVFLLTCASMATCFYVAWKYRMNPFRSPDQETYQIKYYGAIHTRASPWLIGVIAGYFIHEIKANRMSLKLNKFIVIGLWMVSLAVLAACVFAGNDLINAEFDNRALNSIYIAFVRPSWALAVAWIVFACVLGYGGIINDFLSINIFQIIARVTYSMYLTHMSVIAIYVLSNRTPPRFSPVNELYYFWAHFVVVFGISVIWTLAFESPIIILEKKLRGNSPKQETRDVSTVQQTMSTHANVRIN